MLVAKSVAHSTRLSGFLICLNGALKIARSLPHQPYREFAETGGVASFFGVSVGRLGIGKISGVSKIAGTCEMRPPRGWIEFDGGIKVTYCRIDLLQLPFALRPDEACI